MPFTIRQRRGFTLVELLVVIAIIGILVGLLLPAVQAAREAARRAQCTNNLKQMALGWHLHENTHGFLPSGGWGFRWLGDADRGVGENQPGGWRYSILPYIEQVALHDLGAGLSGANRLTAMQTMGSTPVDSFYCPSRRSNVVVQDGYNYCIYGTQLPLASKCDYAANRGSMEWFSNPPIPTSYSQLDTFKWESIAKERDGVVHQRGEIKMSQIPDGTSQTFLIGEKYLNPDQYENGESFGDNQNPFTGIDADNVRSTHLDNWPPLADRPGLDLGRRFGSAHVAAMQYAFADGNVQTISYDIDKNVYWAYGSRNGQDLADENANNVDAPVFRD